MAKTSLRNSPKAAIGPERDDDAQPPPSMPPVDAPVKLLLIDDHALFRTGLRLIVGSHPQVGHILEAGSLDAASALATSDPDVRLILLDVQLPGINGLEGMSLLKKPFPLARCIIVSASIGPDAQSQAQARGAAGYIPKSATSEQIAQAISDVLAGKPYFHQPGHGTTSSRSGSANLTSRQLQVLDLLAQGKPNKLIARSLELSENTVRVHVRAVFDYLGARSRSQAIVLAMQRGLIAPRT